MQLKFCALELFFTVIISEVKMVRHINCYGAVYWLVKGHWPGSQKVWALGSGPGWLMLQPATSAWEQSLRHVLETRTACSHPDSCTSLTSRRDSLPFVFFFFNLILFLPNIKMNPPQVYTCSPSWTLLAPPSPHHPSGSSQCTSPKHPVSMHDSLPFDKWSLWVCPVNMRRMAHVPPSPPLIVSAGRKASQSSQTLASHFFHDTVGKNQIPWGPPLGIDNPSI